MEIRKNEWTLFHKKTGKPVIQSERVMNFRNEPGYIEGGSPPHKAGSTGSVFARLPTMDGTYTYYPSVYGLEWKRD